MRSWTLIWLNASAAGLLAAVAIYAGYLVLQTSPVGREFSLGVGGAVILALAAAAHIIALLALWRPDRVAGPLYIWPIAAGAIGLALLAVIAAATGDGLALVPTLPALLLAMSWLKLRRYAKAAP